MTELDTPGHRALIAVPLTVFNAVIIGASSLYQATRSTTITITLTAAAAVFGGWTLWLGTRARQASTNRHDPPFTPEPTDASGAQIGTNKDIPEVVSPGRRRFELGRLRTCLTRS